MIILNFIMWIVVVFGTLFINTYFIFKVLRINKDMKPDWIRLPIIIEKDNIPVKCSWVNIRYEEIVGIRPSLGKDLKQDGTILFLRTMDDIYIPTYAATIVERFSNLSSFNNIEKGFLKIPIEVKQVVLINPEDREDEDSDSEDSIEFE